MTRLKHKDGTTYIPSDDPVIISADLLDELREIAIAAPCGNSRILLHVDATAALHEMVIVHRKGCYVRPHINGKSSKSYVMMEGEMIVGWFGENGKLSGTCLLSSNGDEANRIIRFEGERFHTLIPTTETVTFVESILGPHTGTTYAAWAPSIDDPESDTFYVSMKEQIICNSELVYLKR